MSFANFKPEIWSTQLLLDRDTAVVGVKNSTRQYENELKKGEIIHIKGLNGATIKDLPDNGIIDDAEEIEDTALDIQITEKKYINFKVEDIDKVQADSDQMRNIIHRTANNLAIMQDNFVYGLAKNGAGKTIDATSTKLSSANIFDFLNEAFAYIRSSNVFNGGEMFVEMHPYVMTKLQKAFTMLGQTNNAEIKNGYRGPYAGSQVYETNVLSPVNSDGIPVAPGTESAIYPIIVRTKDAIAFVEQKSIAFKPYEIERGFGDGIKGYCLYGGKVIRPKELVVINAVLENELSA